MPRLGENPTYDDLVFSVRNRFSGADDMRVVNSTHGLPAPDPIGQHTPELTARSAGRFIIGVARTGIQLEEEGEEIVEALREFLAWRDEDGERALIHLRVPDGWEEHGHQAFERAGGDREEELNDVGSVRIRGVAPPG